MSERSGYEYPPDWMHTTLNVPMDVELVELIKAIRNRCDIFLAIRGITGLEHAIPTLLEDLFEDSQDVVDYCVVKDA